MPLVNGWDGPKDDEEDLDKALVRTVTCYWEKEFDNNDLKATQAGIDFTDATGIGIGSRWPEFPDCFCVSMKTVWDTRSAAPKRVARVSLTYTNQPDSSASANASVGGPSAAAVQSQQAGRPPAERQANPILRRPDVRFNGELRQVFRRYDAAGKLYANVVGDAYIPSLATELGAGEWVIGKNYPWLAPPTWAIDYQGKVNGGPVLIPEAGVIYPAYFLKLGRISIEPIFENGFQYWRATFPLQVRSNFDHTGASIGWIDEVPEMGKNEYAWPAGTPSDNRNFSTAKKVAIRDSYGQPVNDPQFLNRWGESLNTKLTGWEQEVKFTKFYPYFTFNMDLLFQ